MMILPQHPARLKELGKELCPICGHRDRCKATPTREVIACFRTSEQEINGYRRIKQNGECTTYARGIANGVRPATETIVDLAAELGVGVGSLQALGVTREGDLWAFPEKDAVGKQIALNRRFPDGSKRVRRGDKRGLIYSADIRNRPDPVIVVEGPTDTAAGFNMGITTVGRPMAKGGIPMLAELLRDRDVIVVGENDRKTNGDWPGRDGAEHVARELSRLWGKQVAYALPPDGVKDLRDWFRSKPGADPKQVGQEVLKYLQARLTTPVDNRQTVAPTCATKRARLLGRNLGTVKPRPIQHLWREKFLLRKVGQLASPGGMSKSLIVVDMTARITTGAPFPDTPDMPNPMGEVFVFSGEDDPDDVWVPRLLAAGGNPHLVTMYNCTGEAVYDEQGRQRKRLFNLHDDLPKLHEELVIAKEENRTVRMVAIDPVAAYMARAGKINTHMISDVRAVIQPLGELATEFDLAVIIVNHFNKDESKSARNRVSGSTAYIDMCRTNWTVCYDPKSDDKFRRLFLPLKWNYSGYAAGRAYRIDQKDLYTEEGEIIKNVPFLTWETGDIQMTADQALAPQMNQRAPKTAAAVDWLKDKLKEGGMYSEELLQRANEAGITRTTLFRAKTVLGIKPRPSGFKKDWVWCLPDTVTQDVPSHKSRNSVEMDAPMCDETEQSCANVKIADCTDCSVVSVSRTNGTDCDLDDADRCEQEEFMAAEAERMYGERVAKDSE